MIRGLSRESSSKNEIFQLQLRFQAIPSTASSANACSLGSATFHCHFDCHDLMQARHNLRILTSKHAPPAVYKNRCFNVPGRNGCRGADPAVVPGIRTAWYNRNGKCYEREDTSRSHCISSWLRICFFRNWTGTALSYMISIRQDVEKEETFGWFREIAML